MIDYTSIIEEKLREALEENTPWCHKNVSFTIQENVFCLHIDIQDDKASIHLWADNGSTSLYSGNMSISEDAEKYKKEIVDRINDFINGIIHCSDCSASFPVIEVKGYKRSYFAGRYCQKCWDNKWKAIEARETYN